MRQLGLSLYFCDRHTSTMDAFSTASFITSTGAPPTTQHNHRMLTIHQGAPLTASTLLKLGYYWLSAAKLKYYNVELKTYYINIICNWWVMTVYLIQSILLIVYILSLSISLPQLNGQLFNWFWYICCPPLSTSTGPCYHMLPWTNLSPTWLTLLTQM